MESRRSRLEKRLSKSRLEGVVELCVREREGGAHHDREDEAGGFCDLFRYRGYSILGYRVFYVCVYVFCLMTITFMFTAVYGPTVQYHERGLTITAIQ